MRPCEVRLPVFGASSIKHAFLITVEPLYYGHHGTTAVCPDYRGVHISEASGILPVGVAMHTRVLLSATKARSRALPCCMLTRKADQRLVLCEPVLL